MFLQVLLSVTVLKLISGQQHDRWWESSVVYQIYPRSFQDSDGDGTGDLAGITSRLDHLAEIGVGAFWLSPIYKSPMADFGYDISDYRDVDPIFGTMEDFERLSATAKEKGLKIIMDFVPNHSSEQHEWFLKSEAREEPYQDYYIWRDRNESNPGGLPNNWLSVFRGSAWEWSERRGQFYYHAFTKEQPDLNYRNPAIRQEMLHTLLFWMDKGVEGFRMDAVPFLFEDPQFRDEPLSGKTDDPEDYSYLSHIYTWNFPEVIPVLAEFTNIVHAITSEKGLVMVEALSEDLTTQDMMSFYNCSDFPFNFNLIVKLKADQLSGESLHQEVGDWLDNIPAGKIPNWVLGNHDNWRLGSRFGLGNIDGFNMVSLLLPGVAVTYNGEEIGMVNTEVSWEDTVDPAGLNCGEDHFMEDGCSRDPERTPMQWDTSPQAGFTTSSKPWLPVNQNYREGVNVREQREERDSHLGVYKQLVELRDSLRHATTSLYSTQEVFSFIRLTGTAGYICVINVSPDIASLDLSPLLLSVEVTSREGEVTIRSSGRGLEGNTVGSLVDLDDLTLDSFESLVIKLL